MKKNNDEDDNTFDRKSCPQEYEYQLANNLLMEEVEVEEEQGGQEEQEEGHSGKEFLQKFNEIVAKEQPKQIDESKDDKPALNECIFKFLI